MQAALRRTLAGNALRHSSRSFHTSAARFVKVGDAIPDLPLQEDSPGNAVSLAKELKTGKGVIIGVPAAFSPACSANHIPPYFEHKSLKAAGKVFVVSVNDAFVVKAWKESLDPSSKSGVRFLADSSGEFAGALDLLFEAKKIFGGDRGKRYALLVEDGKVKEVFVEPDNTGVKETTAEKVLAGL